MPDISQTVLLNLLAQCDVVLSKSETPNEKLEDARAHLLDAISIVKVREKGLSWEEVGKHLGRPKSTLVEAARRAIKIAEREIASALDEGPIEQRNERILDYVVRQGKTYEEGEKKFGLSCSRIGYIVRKAGIPSGARKNKVGRRRKTDIPLAAGEVRRDVPDTASYRLGQ